MKKSGVLLTAVAVALFLSASAWAQDTSSQSSSDQNAASSTQSSQSSQSSSDQNAAGQSSSQTGSEMGGTTTHHHRHGAGGHSIVGCLQKSDSTYTVTTMKGKTYTLDTTNMTGGTDLSAHVGHKVRVRGTVSGGGAAAGGAAASSGGAGGGETIAVTSVTHLSKTCNAPGAMGGGTSGAEAPK